MCRQNGEQMKSNPVMMFKSVWVSVRLRQGTNISGSGILNVNLRKEGRGAEAYSKIRLGSTLLVTFLSSIPQWSMLQF